MPHKKLPGNAPCPCGSGKRYEACCWDKGFEWVVDEAGTATDEGLLPPVRRQVGGDQRG